MLIYTSCKSPLNHFPFTLEAKKKQEISRFSYDEITFVSCPRPIQTEEEFKRAKLAMSSWLSVSNKSTILIFNSSEFALLSELEKLYGKGRIEFGGTLRSNFQQIPFFDDWFIKGMSKAKSRYVCFINGDIIVHSHFLKRVKQVMHALEDKTVLVGQRVNFVLDDYSNLSFGSPNLLNDIEKLVNSSKLWNYSEMGMDFWVFRNDINLFDPRKIPSFIIGKFMLDNWFCGWLTSFIETATLLFDPPAYHIEHLTHEISWDTLETKHNMLLKPLNGKFTGYNKNVKWRVKDGFIEHLNKTLIQLVEI